MPATQQAERCAGTTTPEQVWRVGRPRAKPCERAVTFVVVDGSRTTMSCQPHLGGIVARALGRPARALEPSVSVWKLGRWRTEGER